MYNCFFQLEVFFKTQIEPAEFIECLDAIEHECCMHLVEHPENADPVLKNGLHYLHQFRKTLQKCQCEEKPG